MDRKKRSLLLVDGSATYLFYMTMLLKKLEYAVLTSTSAEDALKQLTGPESLPELVITDTTLPNMSGIEMISQMRKNPKLKSLPVIIHSSETESAAKEACKLVDCTAYFRKPADPDSLYQALQTATEATPRQNIRIELSLDVEVGKSVSRGASRRETVTTLSEGGLYIQSLTPEPVHAVVPLKLFIRNRELKVTAVVLYSSVKIGGRHKVPGMGMKFLNISPEDKVFLHDFIQEQITKGLALPNNAR
jgi:CheY-like chemotaxis protein